MIPEDPTRICTTCDIPHIENCPECFGFGFRNGVPLAAGKATERPDGATFERCVMCGSDARGHAGCIADAPRGVLESSVQAVEGATFRWETRVAL